MLPIYTLKSLILLNVVSFYNLCNILCREMFKNEVIDRYMPCIMQNLNQEAHRPHRSPEKQFQSIYTFAQDKIRPQCCLKEKKDKLLSSL